MKKLLLIVAALLLVFSCWAQGVVDFDNENLKLPPNPRVRHSNGARVVGPNYVAQLAPANDLATTNKSAEFGIGASFLYVIPPARTPDSACAMTNFQGYDLSTVPEPGVWPLTILGIAAIWLLRRKR